MKWPILLACAACVMPAAAHAQRQIDDTIGKWNLTGKGGDCMIGTGSAEGMIAIASPASGGENNGGVMVSKRDLDVQEDDGATLTFSGGGAWSGQHQLTGVGDISAYWVAFPAQRTIDSFPDRWRMTVVRDGRTIVDISVTGFNDARAALWRCVKDTQ